MSEVRKRARTQLLWQVIVILKENEKKVLLRSALKVRAPKNCQKCEMSARIEKSVRTNRLEFSIVTCFEQSGSIISRFRCNL